ncbi:MAG: serine/threonine-protein kinase [Pirellulales bacterium]
MADELLKRGETSADTNSRYDATQMYEPEACVSRQESDVALAAVLLESGIVNERDIQAAVSDWSIHGSVSLAEHLEKRGLLTAAQIEALKQRAAGRVDRARQSIAGGSQAPEAGRSMLLATLERLDGSGRVAKLLGVTVAARHGDHDARVLEGCYELIRKLGQGGLGRVWLARDVNLNRHVALKEISHPTGVSEAMIERFRHEAEITGRLDHPSIVPIYQLGKDESSGRMFYAMRFLGRTTLQDSINEYHERRLEGNEDPMLLRHLLSAFVNVCHAIGHAHSRKVIHRDLKPENVVIDSFGQVIVIDWGLAKVIDETSVESLMDSVSIGSSDRTNEGQVLGTPLYMAPEQAAGRLDELDPRTDIYGLGAILFAIVTGAAPHEKTQKASVDSGVGARGMISVIASGEVPAARDANADVDPALDAICRKAMARRRYARYQRATELAEDVQRWMAGEPVTAYAENSWQRMNRWIAQHPRIWQAILGSVMVVLVALTTLAMAARHSYVAERDARFAQVEGDVHEVSLQMHSAADELEKDARFVATLPGIQGIANARAGVAGDDEKLWRDRLESIFAGMLRSNPDYLAISFEAKAGDGAADIVRVERNPADPALIRVVPQSRLHKAEADELMSKVASLEPGDVKLSLEPRARHVELMKTERMSVATPVFSDETGECFGMAVIETDISKRIENVLRGLRTSQSELFVGDGSGQLWAWVDAEAGVHVAKGVEQIPGLPQAVADRLKKVGEPFQMREEDEYVAQRFYVDPTGRGAMIFARMIDEE